jgi:integrase
MDESMDDIARREPQRRVHTGRRYPERLTDLKARRLTKPGRHADGAGLYLFVSKTGCKSWVFIFTRDGRKREFGLGAYPVTTLAAARRKAKERRVMLSEGKIPPSGKEAVQAARKVEEAALMTLGAACDQFIALSTPSWRKNTLLAWRYSLGDARCLALRTMPITATTSEDVINTIKLFPPVAQKTLLIRLAAVFDWAAARGFIPHGRNPARLKIEQHLAVEKRKIRHRAALPWRDAPAFMRDLYALAGVAGNEGVAASALEFQILTCTRPLEARGARWEEFDENAAVWTIPAGRMKQDRAHRVPLSSQALALFRRMKNFRTTDFIFHGLNGRPINRKYMSDLCAGRGIHMHGFRSTFDDWSAYHELSFELTEISLAHKFGSAVSQAYRRDDLLEQRRPLMQKWADFLDGVP